MFVDNSLVFSTWASPGVAVTTTADSSVVDLTGAGSGTAPNMIGANGVNTAMGVDIGQGDGVAIPYLFLSVRVAFTSSGSTATLIVTVKAAPDDGSYGQGTYYALYSSPTITTAQLTAGQQLIVPIPQRFPSGQPGAALPRFYKLVYTVASGPFTAGSLSAGIVLNPPNGFVNTQYGSNFTAV